MAVLGKKICVDVTGSDLQKALDEVGQRRGPLPGLVDAMAHNPTVDLHLAPGKERPYLG